MTIAWKKKAMRIPVTATATRSGAITLLIFII